MYRIMNPLLETENYPLVYYRNILLNITTFMEASRRFSSLQVCRGFQGFNIPFLREKTNVKIYLTYSINKNLIWILLSVQSVQIFSNHLNRGFFMRGRCLCLNQDFQDFRICRIKVCKIQISLSLKSFVNQCIILIWEQLCSRFPLFETTCRCKLLPNKNSLNLPKDIQPPDQDFSIGLD